VWNRKGKCEIVKNRTKRKKEAGSAEEEGRRETPDTGRLKRARDRGAHQDQLKRRNEQNKV